MEIDRKKFRNALLALGVALPLGAGCGLKLTPPGDGAGGSGGGGAGGAGGAGGSGAACEPWQAPCFADTDCTVEAAEICDPSGCCVTPCETDVDCALVAGVCLDSTCVPSQE